MPVYHERIGQLLLSAGFITEAQLNEALAMKEAKPYFRIGELLLGLGYLSLAQLGQVLEMQHQSLRLGQILLRRGVITGEQLEIALRAQERQGLKLGDTLIELGYCSPSDIRPSLEYQTFYRTASSSMVLPQPQPQG